MGVLLKTFAEAVVGFLNGVKKWEKRETLSVNTDLQKVFAEVFYNTQ